MIIYSIKFNMGEAGGKIGLMKRKKIVVVGGGTGTFVTLTGLRQYPVDLTAIITMMDSGGSTGRLRDQLGVLPPGDLRQALVALSDSQQIWRDLFVYRFESGDLREHNFGNIFLSALEKMTGSIEEAIDLASFILNVRGEVVPVTFDRCELCVELVDGFVIEGVSHIDEPREMTERPKIKRAFLNPSASPNPRALGQIEPADLIVVGPGDLYTSIIPNLLVKGVSEAIRKSPAKKIFVMNLMTKYGQTTNYTASEHIEDLEKYLGAGVLDTVLINHRRPSQKILDWYLESHEVVVEDNLTDETGVEVLRADLLSEVVVEKSKADKTRRSLIRHDSQKLARSLLANL